MVCAYEAEDTTSRIQALHDKDPTLIRKPTRLGNLPLHLAAQFGQVEVCKILLTLGAPPDALNKNKQTALNIALQEAQRAHSGPGRDRFATIAQTLEEVKNPFTTRVGNGLAKAEAREDLGIIVDAEWYTIMLPGPAGAIGARHSLLKITVETPGGGERREYVLEKAEGDMPQGVFVSHWKDVAPNVHDLPIHHIHGPQQVENRTAEACAKFGVANPTGTFTVDSLFRIAEAMGEYDVGRCHCHHQAQELFNACAADGFRVEKIPNQLLTSIAYVLRGVGVNVTGSGAGSGSGENQGSISGSTDYLDFSLQSESSASASLAAEHRFPVENNCRDHDHARALECLRLAAWIQNPECNVIRNRTPISVHVTLLEPIRTQEVTPISSSCEA